MLGLGKSGLTAPRAGRQRGRVWAWDDDAPSDALPTTDLYACDWTRPSALVLSPGIPFRFPKPHPVAAKAEAAGCPVIGEVELLFRAQPRARYLGITGTNGKSTTTALIGHLLARAGRRIEVGANLGTPALALAPLAEEGTYVLEMSSYQLELVPSARFDIGVLLNITPDHLDRHGGMAGYAAAKARIFQHQKKDDWAVIGIDDEPSRHIHDSLRGQHVATLAVDRAVPNAITVQDAILRDESGREVMDLGRAAALPGPHNWQNAAAAYATARALGLPESEIIAGIEPYPGLPHRQELIAARKGIRFVNDSKATNSDATAASPATTRSTGSRAGGPKRRARGSSLFPVARLSDRRGGGGFERRLQAQRRRHAAMRNATVTAAIAMPKPASVGRGRPSRRPRPPSINSAASRSGAIAPPSSSWVPQPDPRRRHEQFPRPTAASGALLVDRRPLTLAALAALIFIGAFWCSPPAWPSHCA